MKDKLRRCTLGKVNLESEHLLLFGKLRCIWLCRRSLGEFLPFHLFSAVYEVGIALNHLMEFSSKAIWLWALICFACIHYCFSLYIGSVYLSLPYLQDSILVKYVSRNRKIYGFCSLLLCLFVIPDASLHFCDIHCHVSFFVYDLVNLGLFSFLYSWISYV